MGYDITNYGTNLCLISHPSVPFSCSGPSIPLSINLEHFQYSASPFTPQPIWSINVFNKYMKVLVKKYYALSQITVFKTKKKCLIR